MEAGDITIKVILDLILCFIVGLPSLIFEVAVYPFQRGFYCNDETLKYPYKKSTISTTVLIAVGAGVVVIFIVVCETVIYKLKPKAWDFVRQKNYLICKRPVHKYISALYISLGAYAFGVCFCVSATDIFKNCLGTLRPHWFSVCQPDFTKFNCTDSNGYMKYIEDYTCTGDPKKIKEARLSFVSGHASFAMYSMVYLALYIQAKITWRGSKILKHFLQIVFLYTGLYTCLSRISDHMHHWSDVLGGSIVGTLIALLVAKYVSNLFTRKRREYLQNLNEQGVYAHKLGNSTQSDGNQSDTTTVERSVSTINNHKF